jgi:hypothetical protein
MNILGELLQRYTGGAASAEPPQEVEQHFDQVAQHAPPSSLADGLAEAFRSDRTPPFPQMLGRLFGQSNGTQRAGILNQLLATVGPGMLGQVLGGLGGGLTGGHISPQQAEQVSPQQVEDLAQHAQQKDPSIVDSVSRMYAQHPDVFKALGGAALAIAIGRIAQRERAGG